MSIPSHATQVFGWKSFDVYQWEQEMLDGSSKIFEKLKRNNTVDVVAVLKDWTIVILEEQQPGRDVFYGLVWWTCEAGESSLETAKRELLEETWLVSEDWELYNSYTLSSRIDYTSNIFIARDCELVAEQNLDPGWEHIIIKQLDREDFINTIADPKFRVGEFALEVLREIFLWKEDELKRKILKSV